MVEVAIVPATAGHVTDLAESMRPADRLELARLGYAALPALSVSRSNSHYARTAMVDGVVAAMWGVVLGVIARPWFLTGMAADLVPALVFARIYRRETADMRQRYGRLENYIDADHEAALRMVKLAGFHVDPPVPYGVDGALFCRYWVRR